MKKYTFLFEADVWFDNNMVTECGFISADTFSEVVNLLEEYYGDSLDKLHLECSDSSLITMDRETARKIWEKIPIEEEVKCLF